MPLAFPRLPTHTDDFMRRFETVVRHKIPRVLVPVQLLLALVVLDPAAAQTPKPKPKPPTTSHQKDAAPSEPRIKLLLTPDAPCTVTVNGMAIGRIDEDQARQVPAVVGDNLVQAQSAEESEARWSGTVVMEAGKTQVVVPIGLRGKVEAVRAARAAAEQARQAAAAEQARQVAAAEQARQAAAAEQARQAAAAEQARQAAAAERARRAAAVEQARQAAAVEQARKATMVRQAEEGRRKGWVLIDGLQWAFKDNGRTVDWKAAKRYCEKLTLAGHNDWRLPTIDELQKIYDPSSSEYYKVRGGIKLTECCQWSSSLKDSSSASSFSFLDGVRDATYPLNIWGYHRALCVRVPQP